MKPILLFLLISSQAFGQIDTVHYKSFFDSGTILLVDTTTRHAPQDTAYWNHITKHERFKFVKADTTVTGIVTKIFTERDGDLHVILKQKNKILRCEIICYQRVNEACNGFWNHTKRPKIGSKVMVTGDYIYDRWHHWHEIHPVKKIESL
jgi:hypothetical protein